MTSKEALNVRYSWKHRSQWQTLAVEAAPTPQPIAPESVEEFITEHYWGYTKRSDGSTSAYPVAHPRWQTYAIRSHSIDANFGALYGPAFAHLDAQRPDNILLAEGSEVSVASGVRLDG